MIKRLFEQRYRMTDGAAVFISRRADYVCAFGLIDLEVAKSRAQRLVDKGVHVVWEDGEAT